jgi:hypothetical protein
MLWGGRFRLADPSVSAMPGRRSDPRRNNTGNSTNAIGRAPSPNSFAPGSCGHSRSLRPIYESDRRKGMPVYRSVDASAELVHQPHPSPRPPPLAAAGRERDASLYSPKTLPTRAKSTGLIPPTAETPVNGRPVVTCVARNRHHPVVLRFGTHLGWFRAAAAVRWYNRFCVVIHFPDGNGYPITARPMTDKEKRRYNQWKNR